MTSDPSQLPREEAIGTEERAAEETAVLRLKPATTRRREQRVGKGLGAAAFIGEEQRSARGREEEELLPLPSYL